MGRLETIEADLREELAKALMVDASLIQISWSHKGPAVTLAARAYLLYGERRLQELGRGIPAVVERVRIRHTRHTEKLTDEEFAEHMRMKRERRR